MTPKNLQLLLFIMGLLANPVHAGETLLGSVSGAQLHSVESTNPDGTCFRLDAANGEQLAYVSVFVDVPGKQAVQAVSPWKQVASGAERGKRERSWRHTFMANAEPQSGFPACVNLGRRGEVSVQLAFAYVSAPYITLEMDAGSLPRKQQLPSGRDNNSAQPLRGDVKHVYTPDADVMESAFGQFLTPTGPHLIQLRIPEDDRWDATSPCVLVTSRKRPDDITVQLKLPLTGELELRDLNSYWRVTDSSRTPITPDAGTYRWRVGPTSLLTRDRYSPTWTAFLCMQGVKGSEKHIRNYMETLEVLVRENGRTTHYQPGPGKPRYSTPTREAEIAVKKTFTADSLIRMRRTDSHVPASGLTYRLEAAPQDPDSYSSQRLRPVRGDARLDIRYKRETNNGRMEHCYAIFNPTRQPLQTLAFGYGNQPIPFHNENDFMLYSTEHMKQWKVHIAQRNVGVPEQLAVLSNMDQGGRVHEYVGKLCLAEPPSLRGRMPDMSRIQYNAGFSKG